MMRVVTFTLQAAAVLTSFVVCAAVIAFVAQFLLIFDEVPFFIIFLGVAMLFAVSVTPHFLKGGEYDCTTCKTGKKIIRV